MMDIESIRKRDQWARAVGTRAYSDVARNDYAGTSYQFNKASAQDALADRNWLLSEVDRLSAERDALAKDRARLLRDLTDRDREVQHMREVQIPHIEKQNAQRMAERNRYSGQILHTIRDDLDAARAEVEKLRDCGKPGTSVTDPACGKCIRCLQDLHKAQRDLRNLEVPTMPEPPQ